MSQLLDFMPFFRRSRYPGNEEHLGLYLTGEHEYVEYKQPKIRSDDGIQVPSVKLTKSIIRASMEAVCAFVNTEGGKVFIGVDDDGKVIGVECAYYGSPLTEDDLSRIFSDRLRDFSPSVNRFVKPAVLSLANERKVIVLHVDKGDEGKRYFFRGVAYDRCGPSSPISYD
ncbi:MAG TPA: ATP-binding protein [Chloroflexota bacterium]|nr:ATP-binding protein [Chloroflexota bacterium]